MMAAPLGIFSEKPVVLLDTAIKEIVYNCLDLKANAMVIVRPISNLVSAYISQNYTGTPSADETSPK